MTNTVLKRMPFSRSWQFFNPDDASYSLDNISETIFSDLTTLFEIAAKHQLFYPTCIDDNSDKIELGQASISETVAQIRNLINSGSLRGEIDRIGGNGMVVLPDGTTITQPDLITIDSFRLFERSFSIRLGYNCWTPLTIDYQSDDVFSWQIELAKQNNHRLESFLKELYETLGILVSPDTDELDKEETFWQHGFKLYVDPELLQREYASIKDKDLNNIDEFILIS
jgi:hypothetical protein